ncbi:small acid-soluble spore protein SspI [Priestia taiwanensis]|uniref:Small, acid-soluble spore protein I n=1 Tax=Priestia taiwanensis TaxID=1347902 RepID=A0A917EQR7_9BACI|nr:small acid-soluble spore protein SspI [Priestia taiwanensis]MBM7363499.1 small acid-soluble spore protein I (minor) [Priestia taiwanensis]GGE76639.1 small, acid-soluble spore protein I [Priestia taiwanensis]
MSFNIRGAVIANVSGNTEGELQATITDAIQNGQEKMLPGLGVLFEIIWNNSNEQDRQEMLHALKSGLQ